MSIDVKGLTAGGCRRLLAEGSVSAVELTQAYLDRIAETDDSVGSYLLVDTEGALAAAAAVDAKPRDRRGPWEGVPIAVKDVFAVKGMETTCASRMLKGYIPPYDATVITKLKEAGLIILGKSNMDEFAMGSSTENSAFKQTRNPWDLERVPGGSSGGSAACVAASQAPWALGSDTAGSIRQPAAFCGLTGLKPTYGAVSRYGLFALAGSLDQAGPITRDTKDAAALLDIIAGSDAEDATCVGLKEPAGVPERTDLAGIRIGIIQQFTEDDCEDDVRSVCASTVGTFVELGAVAEKIDMPSVQWAAPACFLITCAEASSNLARFDGVRFGHRSDKAADILEMYTHTRGEGFGPEVKRRIIIGTWALTEQHYDAYFAQAQRVRSLVIGDFVRVFEKYDYVLCPTAPSVAFKFGEKTADPVAMRLADRYTIPASMAGLPAVSVPVGFVDGLPIGAQLIGPRFSERGLLDVAHALEQRLALDLVPPTQEVSS